MSSWTGKRNQVNSTRNRRAVKLKEILLGSKKGLIKSINERDKLYLMRSIRFSKQKSFHSFKTKGVSNFKTALTLHRIAYIGCHAKTQLLLNSYSAQKLSATFIYLNFLTNALKIIKDPL